MKSVTQDRYCGIGRSIKTRMGGGGGGRGGRGGGAKGRRRGDGEKEGRELGGGKTAIS